jgi:hypothetical protein
MATSEGNAEQIDDYLQSAIAISRSQNALALELRAVCTQARRLEKVGSKDEALANLKEMTGRFKEGWETLDLRDALNHIKELEASSILSSHAQ